MSRLFTYLIERQDRHGNISYRAGETDNVNTRGRQHINGEVKSTKGYTLLRIAFTKTTALNNERFLQKQTCKCKKMLVDEAFINSHVVWEPFWQRCPGIVKCLPGCKHLAKGVCDNVNGTGGIFMEAGT